MYISHLALSFIACACFGVVFNVPRKSLITCGFVGMVGWSLNILFTTRGMDAILSTFFTAFCIAMVSHIFAKLYKQPMIIFSVSGIIPLVPGGLAYNAMRNIVENDYTVAIEFAFRALMVSGAIAFGLVFSEVVNQLINQFRSSRRISKL